MGWPHYFDVNKRPSKSGSIAVVAPHFNYDEFLEKNKHGQFRYLLELIQSAVMMCVDEFRWIGSYLNMLTNQFSIAILHLERNIRINSRETRRRRVASLSRKQKELHQFW